MRQGWSGPPVDLAAGASDGRSVPAAPHPSANRSVLSSTDARSKPNTIFDTTPNECSACRDHAAPPIARPVGFHAAPRVYSRPSTSTLATCHTRARSCLRSNCCALLPLRRPGQGSKEAGPHRRRHSRRNRQAVGRTVRVAAEAAEAADEAARPATAEAPAPATLVPVPAAQQRRSPSGPARLRLAGPAGGSSARCR